MTDEEVRTLIARGEGQRTECKAAEADAADLARALAALANSGGGSLLLAACQPCFQARSFQTFQWLVLGWVQGAG